MLVPGKVVVDKIALILKEAVGTHLPKVPLAVLALNICSFCGKLN